MSGTCCKLSGCQCPLSPFCPSGTSHISLPGRRVTLLAKKCSMKSLHGPYKVVAVVSLPHIPTSSRRCSSAFPEHCFAEPVCFPGFHIKCRSEPRETHIKIVVCCTRKEWTLNQQRRKATNCLIYPNNIHRQNTFALGFLVYLSSCAFLLPLLLFFLCACLSWMPTQSC